MNIEPGHPLTVERISQLLEEDILRRRLRVGEPYFTADEAGKQLGVSRTQAHRAFQLLADRDLLVSKPRKGTVIGPAVPFKPPTPQRLQCVHALLDPERIRAGLAMRELIDGLRRALPGFDVQLNYLPAQDPLGYVQQVCDQLDRTGASSGLILFGCPRPVQEFIATQARPAVNFGVVYPTADALPSVTVDNVARGRLLAEHLLDGGCSRLALLLPEFFLPGYRQVFEGVNEALAARRLAYGALELCNVPHDEGSIRAEVRRLLAEPDPPRGWIAQQQLAECILSELQAQGRDDIQLAIDVADQPAAALRHLPHCTPALLFSERVQLAAEMLKRLLDEQPLTPRQVVVPVTLALSDGASLETT